MLFCDADREKDPDFYLKCCLQAVFKNPALPEKQGVGGLPTAPSANTEGGKEKDAPCSDAVVRAGEGQKRRVFGAPPEQGDLPRDHPSRVYRDPTIFGSVVTNKEQHVVTITLRRHLLCLTEAERNYMRSCLKPDKGRGRGSSRTGTSRHDFVDITRTEMLRCPLSSCSYRPLNSRSLRQSIRAHCGAYHKTAYQYVYRYLGQQGWAEYKYPPDPEPVQMQAQILSTPPQGEQKETTGERAAEQQQPQPLVHPESQESCAKTAKNTGTSGRGESTQGSTAVSARDGGKTEASKGRQLVAGGTRYRRGRLADEQPRLLTWMQARALEKETEQRMQGGLVPKDPEWGSGAKTSQPPMKWSDRYDKNVSTPLEPLYATQNMDISSAEVQETQEDWWNDMICDKMDEGCEHSPNND